MPPDAEAPLLELLNLARVYPGRRGRPGRRALDGVSMAVAKGEWVAILGPNGSGKSTLVRILATLDRPDEGSVRWGGRELDAPDRLEAYRRRLGVVFQHPGLDRLLTSRENLHAQSALHGQPRDEAAGAVRRIAEGLGIDDRLDDRVGELSGGLARRCDLARALLAAPSLLVLDEATVGLDHASRTGFLDQLAALRDAGRDGALTVIMTTHLMDEAERADRVVMMHEGRVVREGTPAELRGRIGGMRIRCDAASAAAADVLRDAGLDAEVRGSERVALVGGGHPADLLPETVSRLARAGVAFELSPPTLGDAYLAATGATLTETDGSGA